MANAINLTIYTYGHIDAMYYVLNGITMIMNSKFGDLLIKTISFVATAYYATKAAYAGASGGASKHLIKIASMVMVVNALLIPKTDMLIVDHVSKKKDTVSNIPYGFAIPVGIMEEFGNILTASFEQAFGPVGSANYRDYGMVFGARLLQEARNWKIRTPEFSHNMDNFIRRCVVVGSMIGHKYTINDLLQSKDAWTLVKDNARKMTRLEIRNGQDRQLMTCKEAATFLDGSFNSELVKLISQYKNTDFGKAGNTGEPTSRAYYYP